MYWNWSVLIQHNWWGPSLFRSSCLLYQNCSSSSTSSEWIFGENRWIHIQAQCGNDGWVSQIVPLSIGLILPAGAKFIGTCFFHNFNITRPHFYHSVWEILTIFDDPKTALEQLQELKVSEGGEGDPTRVGPSRFPWVVKPGSIRWNSSLEDALRIYKHEVWLVCILQCWTSPEVCYSEPIINTSLSESIPSDRHSSCSWGNGTTASRCTDSS